MASIGRLLFCSAFLHVFLVSAAARTGGAIRHSDSKSPKTRAEKLIRSLNLFPEHDVNRRSSAAGLDFAESSIVETRLKFPFVKDASIANLGHHAGYYKLQNSTDARLFYFFFESRTKKTDPVVIWLTGGPGCSSELALFYENGPYKIADNLTLTLNQFGWDNASNLIYVDQPVGTGFSYTSNDNEIPHDEEGVSSDLYDFLQGFFKLHPELRQNDFYITGESYAGHYIPAFASRVNQGNKNNEGLHINLKGFAIGNGLTDPEIQYGAYTDYALDNKLITTSQHARLNKSIPECQEAIKLCGTGGGSNCVEAYSICNNIFDQIIGLTNNINYYDIRKKCVGSLCYDFSNMERFLALKSVKDALGVGDIDFVSCSSTVYEAMINDWMRNLEVGIPALLEDGVKLLVYAGEYDLICNWLGNSRWVSAMEWSGQKNFLAAPKTSFKVDGAEAGLLQGAGALQFLKVHDAGHMVPMDQPKASLEMLRRWTQGTLGLTGDDHLAPM